MRSMGLLAFVGAFEQWANKDTIARDVDGLGQLLFGGSSEYYEQTGRCRKQGIWRESIGHRACSGYLFGKKAVKKRS